MFKNLICALFIILFLSGNLVFAQNEQAKWCFGNNSGLDFMTSPPTAFTSVINTQEGCASIADAAGNLLFYTDGITVYDQANALMANGTGLYGTLTPVQSAVIIKKPGSGTLYYIFTLAGVQNTLGVNYSVVDMSLAAGMGSVTVKNAPLYNARCKERLTATKHCNGVDYWIIIEEVGPLQAVSNYRSFLFTSAGVNTTAVVSSIGINQTASGGAMKVSPNGQKIGVANPKGPTYQNTIDLFDFDNSTGVLSNWIALATNIYSSYGCEFSPDGTKFYVGDGYNSPPQIIQWDLCAGSNPAIVASQQAIAYSNYGFGSLQLAPDGKIYVATPNSNVLGVINNPNAAGTGCNYSGSGPALSPNLCQLGLPNFVKSMPSPTASPFTYTINNAVACQTASFTASTVIQTYSLIGCSSFGYSLTNMVWDFGDPVSGFNNSSGINNPVHYYTNLGTYTVQLIMYYSCGGGTDTLRQIININQPCLSVSSTSITCANLGSATVTTAGGTGPYSYTWMPTGQTNSVATGLSPGSYTISVYDLASNNTYTATTVFTSLIPLTGTLNASSSILCNGASTGTASVTNLTGGSGSQNYLWTNGSLTYTAPNPVNLSAGTWSSTVTDALTGCTINNTFVITQPPALTLNIAASTPTACAGTGIVLTGTTSGGSPPYNYTWTAGPTTASYAASQNTGGAYVYTLNSSDASSCGITNTISVGFVNNPTITVSNVSICPLQVGTLTAGGATTYTWSNTTTGNTFTDNPLSATQYTVTGSALACTAAATASIILKPVPVPTLSTNGPLCNGDKLLLTASGGSSYNWTGPPAFSSALQNPTINPAGVNNAGVYNLTITAANSCTAFASVNLTVNPTPTLAVSGSTVCTSQTMSLSASSMAGASYLWSGPLSFTSGSQNVSVSSPSVNQSGNYTVIATSLDGCTNTAIASLSVVSPPGLGVSLSSASLCAQALSGSPNTITLTSSGANTYTLSTPNHLYNPNPSGPSSPLSMQPPYQMTGPATATLFGSNGVCTLSITAGFTVVPNPTVTVSSPTPVICAGQSYTYTSSGASSYTWSAASPGSTVYTTGSAVVASPTVNSVFSVTGSSLGCNSALQSSNITVNPLPQVLADPLVLVCKGNSVQLTASGPSSSYTWSPNLFLNTTTGSIVNASPPALQSYMVIGSLNNCTTSAVVTVSVLPLPTALITTSTQNVCVNDHIVLQGSGGNLYDWSGPSGFSATGQSIRFNALSTAYAGNYTLTVSDQNGCKGSARQAITVYALPQGYFNSEGLKGCAPLCSSLDFKTSAGSNPVTALSWQANGQVFSGNHFKTCFNNPGNYTITGILNDINNCVNTLTAIVNVYPKPEADFSFAPASPVENFDEVRFSSTSTGAQINQWSWYFTNNKGYRSDNENPNYLFTDAGTYPIALVVSNAWGCADSVVKSIRIESDFAIYVPDAFTPNEDGLNEWFGPVMRGVTRFSFSIFDRWGTKIFETTDLTKAWDGTFKGQLCQQGVYVWKLNASSEVKTQNLSGQVLLYR